MDPGGWILMLQYNTVKLYKLITFARDLFGKHRDCLYIAHQIKTRRKHNIHMPLDNKTRANRKYQTPQTWFCLKNKKTKQNKYITPPRTLMNFRDELTVTLTVLNIPTLKLKL